MIIDEEDVHTQQQRPLSFSKAVDFARLNDDGHVKEEEEDVEDLNGGMIEDDNGEVRYVPKFCNSRALAPFTCFFKVHGGVGKIPALTDGQWATLFACCLCGYLNAYDWELWPLALTQFQNDLNVTETDIGIIGSAIRVGNALSFPVSALGDAYGRKRVRKIYYTYENWGSLLLN